MIKVFIILVNYGNTEDTIECYESILKNNYTHYQVVTVDVANKNNSFHKLKNWHEKIDNKKFELLQLTENKGFAYANNFVLKYIIKNYQAEFIWILNNDTIIKSNSLAALVKFYKKNSQNENIGFIGSKIMEYYFPEIIQTVGDNFNQKTGYSTLLGKGEKDKGQFDNIILKPDYVIGASMFFHVDIIKKIGFMPEDYFLYYEDLDWCFSAGFQGFTNFTCTESVIFHKQGGSTGNKQGKTKTNLSTRKYMYSSYLRFYRKHFKNYLQVAYLFLIRQFFGRIFRLQFKEGIIILKVITGL